MELNILNQFSAAVTLTATGFLTSCIDTTTTRTHPENELDPIGVFIPFNTVKISGTTETYQFQVINDSNVNGTTTPQVVSDTGTMTGATDNRLQDKSYIWLEIDWNLVQQQYLMVKFTGANTPSIVLPGCWLARKSEVSHFQAYANNYVV